MLSVNAYSQTNSTASVNGVGWKRVAYCNGTSGRGFGKISLYTSGGNNTPYQADIEWFKDWSVVGGISLSSNAKGGYWSAARVTYSSDTTFIEVNFTTSITSLQLISDNYGWNVAKLYSGALPDGGGTVRAQAQMGRINIEDKLMVAYNGNVGIGTTNPTDKLAVNGNIRAKEIKVETANWPDYVFEKDHKLMSLDSLGSFINKNGHLPDIPTAKEVELNGVQVGEMVNMLLKKNEELTLYILQQDKRIKELEKK
ncbi:hypothetical protein GCM10011418_44220 [Sphingobacterium alkalisoli]|nr:hypothetical protein GCM10011418_44220 [Sphingobacterium alkalisoli]